MHLIVILRILVTVLLQTLPAAPEVSVDRSDAAVVTAGQPFAVVLRLDVGATDAAARVRALPPERENLDLLGIETQIDHRGGDDTLHYRFTLRFSGPEAGAASVSGFQIEMLPPGDGAKPTILTAPGFSLQISSPFRWEEFWPWLLLVFLGLAIIAVAAWRAHNASLPVKVPTEEEERRAAIIDALLRFKVRGEWKDLVDTAFETIHREAEMSLGISGGRLTDADIAALAKRWPEFPALWRLGEEVRYGGYQPARREALYVIREVKRLFATLQPSP